MYLHLNLLSNLILSNYFNASNCLLIFSDNSNFNYNGHLPFIKIELINSKFDPTLVFNYFGCQGIVFHTKTPVSSLMFLEDEMRHHMDRFNFRRYLFLPTDDMMEEFTDVLEMTELEYVADLLIIYPVGDLETNDMDSNNMVNSTQMDIDELKIGMDQTIEHFFSVDGNITFQLITHSFVGMNTSHDLVLLDRWNYRDGFDWRNNLYPDKIYNGQGKAFRIATFTYEPYSVPASRAGTELQLAIEFAQRLNLTSELVVDEEGEWGEIYDNWTGYGILGNVMYDNGDVGLAALYTWAHEYLFLDLSKPVVRTGITCLAPAPTLAGGWLVPLFSFSYEMWIAVAISFFVCIISQFLMEFYKTRADLYIRRKRIETNGPRIFQNSTLKTAGIFLLQSVTSKSVPKDRSGNYIFGCMLIFSVLLASTYSSGLASSMTAPRYVGAIKTVQDLVDSGIQWGATSIAWIMSIMGATEPNYLMLLERFVKTSADNLKKYNNKRFAFSIERLPAGYYAIGSYITEEGVADLRIMSEDLYWEQCVLMTKKSSVWMPALDDFILKLAETGIQRVWEYKTVVTHLNPKIQRAVKFSSHHSEQSNLPFKLRWEHIQGAFGILIIGTTFASLTFVWEIIGKRRKYKKKQRIGQDIHLE